MAGYSENANFGDRYASGAVLGKTYASDTPAAPMTSCSLLVEQVEENQKFAIGLAERAERMADRLLGVRPTEDDKSAGLMAGGNGLIDTLRTAASLQAMPLARIAGALDRMERDIG